MEKILRKNGLDDTRYQLQNSTSSSKRLSIKKKDSDQSVLSSKHNFHQSRICRCKQSTHQHQPFLMEIIDQQKSANQFQRTQRIQKPFNTLYHSPTKPQFTSNNQFHVKPTVEKHGQDVLTPSIRKKKSFSSKKQQLKTQPIQKARQLHRQINQKGDSLDKSFNQFPHQTNSFLKEKQNRKIQQIITFLIKKLSYKCPLQNHERNKSCYVCLQSNCFSRIGCSYCFLHNHQNHLKTQISTCIKDLEELSFKVNASQHIFSSKVKTFYAQFNQKLDRQVENIKTQFYTNLSFVKMKVKNQFQSYYKQKYFPYLHQQTKSVSEFRITTAQEVSPPKFSIDHLSGKKNPGQDEAKEKELLINLVGLKFDQVYSYLIKRSEILYLESAQSKILLQYFQEMNSSLTKFFSAFKRNLPKIFAERIFLQKPSILQ